MNWAFLILLCFDAFGIGYAAAKNGQNKGKYSISTTLIASVVEFTLIIIAIKHGSLL